MDPTFYGDGIFDFICFINPDKLILQHAHSVVTHYGLWEWLRNNRPKRSYIMNSSPEVILMKNKIRELNPQKEFTEFTLSFTLTVMYYISKNGYEKFKQLYIDNDFFEII